MSFVSPDINGEIIQWNHTTSCMPAYVRKAFFNCDGSGLSAFRQGYFYGKRSEVESPERILSILPTHSLLRIPTWNVTLWEWGMEGSGTSFLFLARVVEEAYRLAINRPKCNYYGMDSFCELVKICGCLKCMEILLQS